MGTLRSGRTTYSKWEGLEGDSGGHTHVLSSREDRTTDTEEAAMAAEPIQGCSTRPAGMNTPGEQRGDQPVSEETKGSQAIDSAIRGSETKGNQAIDSAVRGTRL